MLVAVWYQGSVVVLGRVLYLFGMSPATYLLAVRWYHATTTRWVGSSVVRCCT